MSTKFTIAHIYAKAVFNVSIQHNTIGKWLLTLELLSNMIQNFMLQSLCHNILDKKKLSNFWITLFADYSKYQLDQFEQNFIYIIIKNKRILLLPIIFQKFNDLYNNYINSTLIEITSARKLSDTQLQQINEIMTHRLSKTVKIVCHINTNILAGIIIKIGDTIIDGSLTGRILRLRKVLQF